MWWPGTELNRRRQPFQGCALPPELPGHFCRFTAEGLRVVGYANIGGIAGNRGLLQCGSWWNSPIIAIKRDSLNVRSALFVFALFPASAPSAVDCDLFVGRMPLMKDIDRLPPSPLIFWNQTDGDGPESKSLSSKHLEAKY